MDIFFLYSPWIILGLAGILLTLLFIIDLRTCLLPDRYVFPFGILGVLFHASTHFELLPPLGLALGALFGGGLLWIVRWGGTKYYKQEAMGLGDVKLLGAAGLWLGPEYVINAIMFGAMAGLAHGLVVAGLRGIKSGSFAMNRLIIPAGPGFIVGIVGVFAFIFARNLPPFW